MMNYEILFTVVENVHQLGVCLLVLLAMYHALFDDLTETELRAMGITPDDYRKAGGKVK